jgi:voltage-gated potassium channel
MKNSLKKIVFNDKNKVDSIGVLAKRIENIHGIWNNTHHDDVGVEKILRLFLAISQFLFPGIYIKQLFWKKETFEEETAK